MADSETGGGIVRIGAFDLDLGTGELRRDGSLVPLRPQPTRLLLLLAQNAGRLVERDEIRSAVWSGTVVEFDQGINACVRQLRSVLGDSATEPRYIETVPRRGYRLIAPVAAADEAMAVDSPSHQDGNSPAAEPVLRAHPASPAHSARRERAIVRLVVVLACATTAAAAALWLIQGGSSPVDAIAVTALPGRFADIEHAALPDTLAARISEAISSRKDRNIRLVPWTEAGRFDPRETADYLVSATADQRGARIIAAAEIHGTRAALPIWRREYVSSLSAIDSLAQVIANDVATAIHGPSLWADQ